MLPTTTPQLLLRMVALRKHCPSGRTSRIALQGGDGSLQSRDGRTLVTDVQLQISNRRLLYINGCLLAVNDCLLRLNGCLLSVIQRLERGELVPERRRLNENIVRRKIGVISHNSK